MRQCGSILDKNIRGMVLYFLSLLQLHPMQEVDYLTFNAGSHVAYDSLIGDYVTFGCVIETFKLKIFSIFNNGFNYSRQTRKTVDNSAWEKRRDRRYSY